jgi:hypothetical protein
VVSAEEAGVEPTEGAQRLPPDLKSERSTGNGSLPINRIITSANTWSSDTGCRFDYHPSCTDPAREPNVVEILQNLDC